MQIIKERLDIEDSLNKRINNLLRFNNIKSRLETGYIINVLNTNLAYIVPHKLTINNNTYLFFNDSEMVYINDLTRYIIYSFKRNRKLYQKFFLNTI